MTWIDDAAAKARSDDDDRSRREEAYQQQLGGLWNSFLHTIKRDVEEINRNQDLLTRTLGGEKLRFEELGNQTFKVSKITIPSKYMTVSNRHRYFEVERQGRPTQDGGTSKEPLEKIEIGTDSNYQLYLHLPHTNAGALSFTDMSQHLLGQFLVTVK